jgi:hypothetical protein
MGAAIRSFLFLLAPVVRVKGSKMEIIIGRILDGRVVCGRAVTCGAWALILALAVPAVYGAVALQLEQPALEQSPAPATSSQADRETYLSILGEGWRLTPAEAVRLESELVRDPDNVAARVRLISYYHQQMIAEPRARHILWLIENRPEAEVFRVASSVTGMWPDWTRLNRQADWERARALWLRQAERYPKNTRILANSAQALPLEDSLVLIRRARAVEPGNPEWSACLAMVYARAVRDVFFARQPGDGSRRFAGVGSSGGVRLRFNAALPMAEKLMMELESSADTALVGGTGELLVKEMSLLRRNGTDTPEMVDSAVFGRRLLERAQSLEPGNPRWQLQ